MLLQAAPEVLYAWAVYHAARLDWAASGGMSTVTESYATSDARP